MRTSLAAGLADYERAAERTRAQAAAAGPDAPLRLAKRTSNLFRTRQPHTGIYLDAAPFTGVFAVDPETRTAQVGGMTTYEDLVAATLPHGLMPTVVPQLKTITLGGAVVGLGIESSSWRAGFPHEAVLDADVLVGDGRIVTATPEGQHAALFRGLPNSYGTLGYALRLRIALDQVAPYVALQHLRFRGADDCAAAIARICADGVHDGEPVDFLDGTWFAPHEQVLTLGRFTETASRGPSDYTGQGIYYRSLRERDHDLLTTHDYLWRWDPDWFWCSAAFGAQRPLIRRLWPARLRRSDVYWRLMMWDRRWGVTERLDRWRGRPAKEPVIQDVEVPVERLPDLLDHLHRDTGIAPVWLCPFRARERWPLYPVEPGQLFVNVGFWSRVLLAPGEEDGVHNRRLEQVVADLGGHKSLYSSSFYSEDRFWELYDGDGAYHELKRRYDPAGRFPDLYRKCVTGG